MSFKVRYSAGARDDLKRLYAFLLERDVAAAERALDAIRRAADLLQDFPFTCRKVDDGNPFLRELVIPFGDSGYVALFEIEGEPITTAGRDDMVRYVSILAVRHQREDDYH